MCKIPINSLNPSGEPIIDYHRQFDHALPGAHLFVIVHEPLKYGRIACAIEDASFEIRDCIMYLHENPYAIRDIAYIPIVIARKPLDGTVANNVMKHGCGALNIEGSRIGVEARTYTGAAKLIDDRPWSDEQVQRPVYTVAGRWPANIVHDGSDIVTDAFPHTKTGDIRPDKPKTCIGFTKGFKSKYVTGSHTGDSGSAARFFHRAATIADRTIFVDDD